MACWEASGKRRHGRYVNANAEERYAAVGYRRALKRDLIGRYNAGCRLPQLRRLAIASGLAKGSLACHLPPHVRLNY